MWQSFYNLWFLKKFQLTVHVKYHSWADWLCDIIIRGTACQYRHKVGTIELTNVELISHQTMRSNCVTGVYQTASFVPIYGRWWLTFNKELKNSIYLENLIFKEMTITSFSFTDEQYVGILVIWTNDTFQFLSFNIHNENFLWRHWKNGNYYKNIE